MMITKLEKQEAAEQITQSYQDLETNIMQNIIRHIKDYKKPIDSDDWLLQKLAELGKLNQENIKLIARAAGTNGKQVTEMLNTLADTVVQRVDDLPDLRKIKKPSVRTENIQRAVKTVHKQAKDSFNKTNTTMLYKAQDAFKEVVRGVVDKAKELARKPEFLKILGDHATAEAIGAESRGQAIRSVLQEFNSKGIPAFIDKRGRQWTPEAYVSMTLRTTAGNVATEAMTARMDDLGLSLIQVSSHSGARPKCAKDQGKIFDKNGGSGTVEDINGKKIRYYPFSSSSYGEPDGLFGINCGHHGKPFIPGVSRSHWEVTKDLEENDKEYRKMQVQRSLEREVRKQKRLCSLYSEIDDKEAFESAAVALKSREARLANYTEKKGLNRRKDREQVVGFDRKAPAKKVEKQRNVVIEPEIKVQFNRNHLGDAQEIKSVGDEILSRNYKELSLEEFKKMHHTVTKEERKIIYGKTFFSGYVNSSNARKINGALRNRNADSLSPAYQEIADTLSTVIQKNQIEENIIVDRYVATDALEAIAGVSFPKTPGLLVGKSGIEKYWQDIDSLSDKIQKGHIYTEKGFLSTSGVSDKNVMQDKGILLRIKVPKGTNVYVSTNYRESEIIFDRGSQLEILNARIKNNRTADLKVVLECVMR